MTKNPIINAACALAYIALIASIMFYAIEKSGHSNSIIIPITVLSLFTLSAAVMGYLFLAQPLQLYLDGKKKDGVKLFLHTVGVFALATAILLVVLLTRVLG